MGSAPPRAGAHSELRHLKPRCFAVLGCPADQNLPNSPQTPQERWCTRSPSLSTLSTAASPGAEPNGARAGPSAGLPLRARALHTRSPPGEHRDRAAGTGGTHGEQGQPAPGTAPAGRGRAGWAGEHRLQLRGRSGARGGERQLGRAGLCRAGHTSRPSARTPSLSLSVSRDSHRNSVVAAAAAPDGSPDAVSARTCPRRGAAAARSSCPAWVKEEARRAPAASGPPGFRGAPGGQSDTEGAWGSPGLSRPPPCAPGSASAPGWGGRRRDCDPGPGLPPPEPPCWAAGRGLRPRPARAPLGCCGRDRRLRSEASGTWSGERREGERCAPSREAARSPGRSLAGTWEFPPGTDMPTLIPPSFSPLSRLCFGLRATVSLSRWNAESFK